MYNRNICWIKYVHAEYLHNKFQNKQNKLFREPQVEDPWYRSMKTMWE